MTGRVSSQIYHSSILKCASSVPQSAALTADLTWLDEHREFTLPPNPKWRDVMLHWRPLPLEDPCDLCILS